MLFKSNFHLTLHPTGGAFWKRNSSMAFCDVKSCFAAPGYFNLNVMRNNEKPTKTVYTIDIILIEGNEVFVAYTANEKDLEGTISLSDLKQFALNHSLNDFIFDTFYNGEHEQDEVTENIDTFLAENLETVIKAYYEAYPLESVLNEIAMLKLVIA